MYAQSRFPTTRGFFDKNKAKQSPLRRSSCNAGTSKRLIAARYKRQTGDSLADDLMTHTLHVSVDNNTRKGMTLQSRTSNDIEPDFIPAAMEDYGRTKRPGWVDCCPSKL